jgi:transcriptional regulator with XRE-family HTH domain
MRPRATKAPRKRKSITETEMAIAKRLKEVRLRRGLMQAEVAKAIGVKQPVLSECESGEIRLHGALLVRLAAVLKVSADEILGLEPVDSPSPHSARLMRRLQRIEELPATDRRTVLSILDALLEKHGRNGHGSTTSTSSRNSKPVPAERG